MVDFSLIQSKIYKGYGKAAIRLGTDHSIYRSSNGINPIASGNLLGVQKISIDADLKYNKARKSGDMMWYFLPQDGLGENGSFALENYDYMVGAGTTYFIADISPDDRFSPPSCYECNAVVTVATLINSLSAGTNAYQSPKPTDPPTHIYLQNVPCAILQYGRGNKELSLKLPTSSSLPHYQIIMPVFDDIVIKVGDILSDTIGRRMQIVSAERTKKASGFRLIAIQLGT
jgi:hypothetical protein